MKISGRKFWLWRAVDQHGVVLEEILQSKRDKRAARRLLLRRFCRKVLAVGWTGSRMVGAVF